MASSAAAPAETTRATPNDRHSSHSPSKLRTYGCAILIIVGIGSLVAAGVGIGALGAQQGWWAAGSLSHLNQVHAIILMSAGGGGGIAFLIIGIVVSVKRKSQASNHAPDNQGLSSLLTQENTSREALEFARTTLADHPEVTRFSWGCFEASNQHPSNPEIARLSFIFLETWLPKLLKIVNPPRRLVGFQETDDRGNPLKLQPAIYKQDRLEDPWADNEKATIADTCLKLSYALVCLTCDDMPHMQRKLPKCFAESFDFGCQHSYQYRWVVLHTRVYQMVRNCSDNKQHSQCFYQEGTIQSGWRNLFNNHCDYVKQCGWSLGDQRYFPWFEKDEPEKPLAILNKLSLPT